MKADAVCARHGAEAKAFPGLLQGKPHDQLDQREFAPLKPHPPNQTFGHVSKSLVAFADRLTNLLSSGA
jgi:hypothetical protein